MGLQHLLRSTVIVGSLLSLGAGVAAAQDQAAANPLDAMRPVTDDMLKAPDDGDWLMWRRTYDGWGYSPLDEINKDNVKDLKVAWIWSLTNGATETTPIVHDGVLFIFNYGDKVQALNAKTGDLLWEYKRELPQELIDAGGNNLAKRNMAIYGDNLIFAASDAHDRVARRQDRPGRLGVRRPPTGRRAGAIPAARSSPTASSSRA